MRLLISILVALPLLAQHFENSGNVPGWDAVLRSLSLLPATNSQPQLIVIGDPAKWTAVRALALAEEGRLLVLSGHSPITESLGIRAESRSISVRQIRDIASPALPIIWA